MASSFGNAIAFMGELGVYDVVLPFLLIFTLVFAILEKTRIFGTEKIDGKEYTRKNLNGMTAFVMAFFVVASTRLVAVINEVLANTVLLLLLSICFLLLAGSFHSGKEEFFLKKGWNKLFMIIMFIGIVLIFLHALGWLDIIWASLIYNFDSVVTSSIVLLIIVVVAIIYITGGFDKKKTSEKED